MALCAPSAMASAVCASSTGANPPDTRRQQHRVGVIELLGHEPPAWLRLSDRLMSVLDLIEHGYVPCGANIEVDFLDSYIRRPRTRLDERQISDDIAPEAFAAAEVAVFRLLEDLQRHR